MPNPAGPIPVLEQIRQNILATIASIAPPRYSFAAIAVEPDRLGTATGDGVIVPMLGSADWNKEVEAAGLIEWLQEFLLVGYTVQSETLYAPWDGQNILRYADIDKAIYADPYRGNWAHDTLPEAPEWFRRSQGQHEGVGVRFYVRYRHNWGDAFTVR